MHRGLRKVVCGNARRPYSEAAKSAGRRKTERIILLCRIPLCAASDRETKGRMKKTFERRKENTKDRVRNFRLLCWPAYCIPSTYSAIFLFIFVFFLFLRQSDYSRTFRIFIEHLIAMVETLLYFFLGLPDGMKKIF